MNRPQTEIPAASWPLRRVRKAARAALAALACGLALQSPVAAQMTTNLSPKAGATGAMLEHAVRKRLAELGMRACTETFVHVAMYLASKQSAAFRINAVGGSAARRPAYMTMESVDPGFPTRYSTLVVGPNCDGLYTQTVRWDESCRIVKDKYFPAFTGEETLLKETTISTSGDSQLSLTPVPGGCLSAKNETFLR